MMWLNLILITVLDEAVFGSMWTDSYPLSDLPMSWDKEKREEEESAA